MVEEVVKDRDESNEGIVGRQHSRIGGGEEGFGSGKASGQIFEKNSFDLFKTIAMTYHDVIQELIEKMNEINGSNAFARMECSLLEM